MNKITEFPTGLLGEYDSILCQFSTGIDSTGILAWAMRNFDPSKIWLCHQNTGFEYDFNTKIVYDVARYLGVKPLVLEHPKGFLGLLEYHGRWPDSKVRWCTSYLKRDLMASWITNNRHLLGERCLYLTGERRDESPGRAKLPELQYHRTHLKTTRKGNFTCHWYRPVLNYEKGHMFEWGRKLGIPPHPCYEYLDRCSCIACVLMPEEHAMLNMARYPHLFYKYLQAELKAAHTWKHKTSLNELWARVCKDDPEAGAVA